MNPLEAVRVVERELAAASVPEPRTDAEILVAHALGKPRSALHASQGDVPAERLDLLRELVARRRAREPLQYILGEWGFRRLTLSVDPRALIPRSETEVVVERCLELLRDIERPRVLEVGAGSGAIALALADEHAGALVTAVESSADALAVARANARRTGLEGRVELVHGELFAGLVGPFHLVVSNPPYVGEEEIASLEPEVRDHEPRGALVGPNVTEAVARGARAVLGAGGWLVLECAHGQAVTLVGLLRSLGYEDVTVTADLAGLERVVEGRTR